MDEDDLNEILGGAITVQCVSEEDHGYKTLTLYELLENALWEMPLWKTSIALSKMQMVPIQ